VRSSHARWVLLVAAGGVGVLACSAVYDLSALGPGDGADAGGGDAGTFGDATQDGTTVGDGASSSDAPLGSDGQPPLDARADGPTKTDGGCPIGEGPAMVRAETVCIDGTEVTRGQYLKFVQSDAGAAFAPAICNWNTSFVPTAAASGDVYPWPPTTADKDYPIAFVDWCDAATYCAWAGKQLCGTVAADGGTLKYNDFTDAAASQWYQACSRNGTQQFPYPGGYAADVCAIDVDAGGPFGVAPVGGYAGCEGGYAKIFDMVGNVYEWLDSCSGDGKSDDCSVAGGGSVATSGVPFNMDCSEILPYGRGQPFGSIGVRCCARP